MTPRRLVALGLFVTVVYVAAFVVLVDADDLPPLTPATVAVLLLAAALQIAAVWFFGELFRQGVEVTGRRISKMLGFRAALVGSTVARLLPAGGAVTPVAMAWTVRGQAPGAGPAAVRATGLNYAGLLLATGGGLLLVPSQAMSGWSREAKVASVVTILVGLGVLVAVAKLGSLGELLPARIRERFGKGLIDHPVGLRSHAFLWGRVGTEVLVLAMVLAAFGIEMGPAQLAAAFGISQLAAGIPGTPGGVGFAEAGLVGALSLFGVAAVVAVAPVLVFRIVSYWVPAGAGLVAGTAVFLRSPEVASP